MSRNDCFSSSVISLPPSSGSAMSIHFWQADWAASIWSSESPSPFIRTPPPGSGSGMSTPCSRMHWANFSIASSGSRSASLSSPSPEGDAEEAPAASGRAESSSPGAGAARGRQAEDESHRGRGQDALHGGSGVVAGGHPPTPAGRPLGERWRTQHLLRISLSRLKATRASVRPCGCWWSRTKRSWPTPSRADCGVPGTPSTWSTTAAPRSTRPRSTTTTSSCSTATCRSSTATRSAAPWCARGRPPGSSCSPRRARSRSWSTASRWEPTTTCPSRSRSRSCWRGSRRSPAAPRPPYRPCSASARSTSTPHAGWSPGPVGRSV